MNVVLCCITSPGGLGRSCDICAPGSPWSFDLVLNDSSHYRGCSFYLKNNKNNSLFMKERLLFLFFFLFKDLLVLTSFASWRQAHTHSYNWMPWCEWDTPKSTQLRSKPSPLPLILYGRNRFIPESGSVAPLTCSVMSSISTLLSSVKCYSVISV